jgi:hypothetical protein
LRKVLSHRAALFAEQIRLASHFVARVAIVVFGGWAAMRSARRHDPLHLGLAVFLGLIVLSAIFTGGIFLWAILDPSPADPD